MFERVFQVKDNSYQRSMQVLGEWIPTSLERETTLMAESLKKYAMIFNVQWNTDVQLLADVYRVLSQKRSH